MPAKRSSGCYSADLLNQFLTASERKIISALNSPNRIQLFLDSLDYGSETVYRSPLRVLRERTCQCFDGAVLAAALLKRLRYPALIINLLPSSRDDDHVLALFQRHGHWGAIAKSNFAGLRFREPVYRTVRELVMSYFELYYNMQSEKTLRGYTFPLDLKRFDSHEWMTRDEAMELISDRLDQIRRVHLLSPSMVKTLSLVDERSCKAGLVGSNKAGLYHPPRRENQRGTR